MYVTLEPCIMCAGAAFWTRIGKMVWGANDDKRGFTLNGGNILHPKTQTSHGILENECSEILKEFFKTKRKPAETTSRRSPKYTDNDDKQKNLI